MNPYAKYLGDRDPLQELAATPGKLRRLVETLGQEGLEREPAPGKWSARKILCHLADTELALGFRLRQALAEPHHVIQPFDQERWAAYYDTLDAPAALEAFTAVRKWNVRLIEAVPRSMYSKRLTHPERGEMTFRELIETLAGHDVNHLRQIEAIATRSAGM